MNERKETPLGIIVFLAFIIGIDGIFFYYLGTTVLSKGGLSTVLSFSQENLLTWFDMLLSFLSLIIIPYGFLKRKSAARFYAMVFLSYSLLRSFLFISMTGEKNIGFLLFALFIISLLYLFSSSIKEYFSYSIAAPVPIEPVKVYTYGLYTLYTELVHLKNGKNQIIYFFSKHQPKSGTPSALPAGYHVEVSDRSGLPYLKKDPSAFPTAS